VDLKHLAQLASYGVPPSIRSEVWKHLLGINSHLKHYIPKEDNHGISEESLDPEIQRIVRKEFKRSSHLHHLKPRAEKMIERIICKYAMSGLENIELDAIPELVNLVIPLVSLYPEEEECREVFQSFVHRLDTMGQFTTHTKKRRIADFIMLVRAWLPELYTHFEEEGMVTTSWAAPLLQSFLANHLPQECLLRLWDTYIAKIDGFEIHVFVCVAILDYCHKELIELDASDIIAMIKTLPVMDMDQIILQAYSIREDSDFLRLDPETMWQAIEGTSLPPPSSTASK
jgi:hypothetical protein